MNELVATSRTISGFPVAIESSLEWVITDSPNSLLAELTNPHAIPTSDAAISP